MARYLYSGYARDGNGFVITSATINIYLAATTTAASVYAASAGGVAVNSVSSGTDGLFEFYVDDTDYYQSQKFKIIIAKTGYTSKTIDRLAIFPIQPVTIVAAFPLDTVGGDGDVLIMESGADHHWLWKSGGKWYRVAGTAVT